MRTVAPAAAIAVAAFLALLPAAAAQDVNSPLSLTVGTASPAPLPYDGNGSIPVTVGVGCAAVLQSAAATPGQAIVVTVGANSTPSWLAVTPASITIDPAACANAGDPASSGYVVAAGTVGIDVTTEAPGVVTHSVNLTASMPVVNAAPATATQSGDFNVTYYANHTITPSIQFPYNMTGRTLNFTVTVTVGANARSMVMFENVRASTGSVSGLASDNYDPPATKVFNVTYTAPSSQWSEAQISFYSYSHVLVNGTDPAAIRAYFPTNTTWRITNGNPGGGDGTTENSPVALAPALAAVALAVVVARRRA